MPKRPATPPPPDDTQFFTVVNPYPEQPYQTDQGSKTFARWIASMVGQHTLYAFHHKPKSPNMVVIEVSKDGFSDFRRLLGEHRWREVLKTPNKDHAYEVSRIFPCTMTTPRSLVKEGWQHINVEWSWFNKWSPGNDSDIVYPYPLPRFCRPPQEDVMRNPLCRPLREALFNERTPTTRQKPILAPGASSTVGFSIYRSPPISDPSDNDLDLEYDSSQTDEPVPTPPGVAPPGSGPLPSTLSSTPFFPAIHGADAPKGNGVTVVPHRTSDADAGDDTLWPGYGEVDAPSPADLCEVHGVMCSSGICRQCGLRKRDAKRELRIQKRLEEREAWNRQHEGGQDRRPRRDRAAWGRGSSPRAGSEGGGGSEAPSRAGSVGRWGTGESRVREDIPTLTTKGKVVGGSSANAAARSGTKLAVRALPPHLRQGASKVTNAASSSPALGLATSTTSSPTSSPSPPSSSPIDGDGQSVPTTSSNSTDIPGMPSGPFAKAKNWQPCAKVPARQVDAASASSTVTGPTAAAFKNPWKRVQPVPSTRWSDMADEDEDEDEDEDKDEDGDGDDLDDLPRGVTVITGVVYGEEGAESDSASSGWDQDEEPF
ncbi:hypothetical protein LXA43DRAFT_1095529 [Ganoderma leucocontextum]|nr:hypothetical protein LXA43DRAFT_1095529 [Ganoderma leucocontextum]